MNRLYGSAFLLILAPLLAAQDRASTQLFDPVRCVFHEGDNIDWAQPEYDDSRWPTAEASQAADRHLWQRCHVRIDSQAETRNLDLQFRVMAAWTLYIDGQSVATSGNPRTGWYKLDNVYQQPLPHAVRSSDVLVVAIRMTRRYRWDVPEWWQALQLRPAIADSTTLRLRALEPGSSVSPSGISFLLPISVVPASPLHVFV